MINFKEFISNSGEIILYIGNPDFSILEELSKGFGDIWHSSLDQGYKNAFPEIVYQTATFFWFVKDFDGLEQCISWRINPNQFAIRKSVWETLNGFDDEIENPVMKAFDFGFNSLRYQGAIPLYIKGLFAEKEINPIKISTKDRYVFFRKNFKKEHSLFMIYRKGIWNFNEWNAYFYAKNKFTLRTKHEIVNPRELNEIEGNPKVSYIIPTMMRQDFTLNLLNDLAKQTYTPTQVVIVDATPENQRDESLYNTNNYPFELIVKWQTSKGSCRARNEGIELSTGDYIVFGDDDIRVPNNYIENHIRFLQTYNGDACNGLDIRADHQKQDLNDLDEKLRKFGTKRYLSGAAQLYNNANNCVKREFVSKLVGNDVNYDGGYGEDNDFGLSLTKIGVVVLQNPFSTNLHLKPPIGGYRFWGSQAKILGKKRKQQPWELNIPVKKIIPKPSPTIMYYFYKHFGEDLVKEFKHKYFFLYLFKGSKVAILLRFFKMPYRLMQFNKSVFYAKNLLALGKRTS
jgi:glycosyltransferase involved in cell wall biosynthesis